MLSVTHCLPVLAIYYAKLYSLSTKTEVARNQGIYKLLKQKGWEG